MKYIKFFIINILFIALFFLLDINTVKASSKVLNDLSTDKLSGDYILTDNLTFTNTFNIIESSEVNIDLSGYTLTIDEGIFFIVGNYATLTIKNGYVVFNFKDNPTTDDFIFVRLLGISNYYSSDVDYTSNCTFDNNTNSKAPNIVLFDTSHKANEKLASFDESNFSGYLNIISGVNSVDASILRISQKVEFKNSIFNTIGKKSIGTSLNELTFDKCEITHNKDVDIVNDGNTEYINSLFYDQGGPRINPTDSIKTTVTVNDTIVKDTKVLFGLFDLSYESIYYFTGSTDFNDTIVFDFEHSEYTTTSSENYRIVINDERTNKKKYKVKISGIISDDFDETDDFYFIKTQKENLEYIEYERNYATHQGYSYTDETNGYLIYKLRKFVSIDGSTVNESSTDDTNVSYTWYDITSGNDISITSDMVNPQTGYENYSSYSILSEPSYDKESNSWALGRYKIDASGTIIKSIYGIAKENEDTLIKVTFKVKGENLNYYSDIKIKNIDNDKIIDSKVSDSLNNIVTGSVNKDETYTFTYYLIDKGNYSLIYSGTKMNNLSIYDYNIFEITKLDNENTSTLSKGIINHEYILKAKYSYFDSEYTIISDIVKGTIEEEIDEQILITMVIAIIVVILLGIYFFIYFNFYRYDKIKGKFFDIIYLWHKKEEINNN